MRAGGDLTVSIGTLSVEGVAVRDPESFGASVADALSGLLRDRGPAGSPSTRIPTVPTGNGDAALAAAIAEAVWAQVRLSHLDGTQ